MAKLTQNTVVRRGFQSVSLKAGTEVPDWALEQVGDHLLDEPRETEPDYPEGDPAESWTVKQLKAYADENGVDLGEATRKAEVLAVLTAPPGDGEGDDDDA